MQINFAMKIEPKLSPALILNARLLQLSMIELEQEIKDELRNNPALELTGDMMVPSAEHSSPARMEKMGFSAGEDEGAIREIAEDLSPLDKLEAQVRLITSGSEVETAVYLLRSLDDRGYLTTPAADLARELDMPVTAVRRVIKILHQLDPPGIGARDLRECLLLQLIHLQDNGVDCRFIFNVIKDAWEDFSHFRLKIIAQKFNRPYQEIEDARRFVASNCYPYPLNIDSDSAYRREDIQPDLVIVREQRRGQPLYQIEIPAAAAWELGLSSSFMTTLHSCSGSISAADRAWINSHIQKAIFFISALNKRWTTMHGIARYIIDYQNDVPDSGLKKLRPLTRTTVARELCLHESTVCRAVDSKTIRLPDGKVIPLSSFFDTALPGKTAVQQAIESAGSKLTDHDIAALLNTRGIHIARRTVAKYRRALKIPSSYSRFISVKG
jgi:RNA polymerase sigma-54 factor